MKVQSLANATQYGSGKVSLFLVATIATTKNIYFHSHYYCFNSHGLSLDPRSPRPRLSSLDHGYYLDQPVLCPDHG